MDVTREQIIEALEGLGDTADRVAQTFEDVGIKGQCGKSRECPVARYVQSFAADDDFAVAADWLWYPVATGGGHSPLPAPVAHFALLFDRYHYPQLIE